MEFQRIAAAARDVVELAAGQHARAPERLDGGVAGDFGVSGPFAVPFQFHVVHEGGQLFASGPVNDSLAFATGVIIRGRTGPFELASIEIYGLISRFILDRSVPAEAGMARPSSAVSQRRIAGGAATFCSGRVMTSSKPKAIRTTRLSGATDREYVGIATMRRQASPGRFASRPKSGSRRLLACIASKKITGIRIVIVAVAGAGWRLR